MKKDFKDSTLQEIEDELSSYFSLIFHTYAGPKNNIKVRNGLEEQKFFSNVSSPMMTFLLYATYNNIAFSTIFYEENNCFLTYDSKRTLLNNQDFTDFMNHGSTYRSLLINITAPLRKYGINIVINKNDTNNTHIDVVKNLLKLNLVNTMDRYNKLLFYMLPFLTTLQKDDDEGIHSLDYFFDTMSKLLNHTYQNPFFYEYFYAIIILAILDNSLRETFCQEFFSPYIKYPKDVDKEFNDFLTRSYNSMSLSDLLTPSYFKSYTGKITTEAAKISPRPANLGLIINNKFRASNSFSKYNPELKTVHTALGNAYCFTLMKTLPIEEIVSQNLLQERINEFPHNLWDEMSIQNGGEILSLQNRASSQKSWVRRTIVKYWSSNKSLTAFIKWSDNDSNVESFLTNTPLTGSLNELSTRITELYFMSIIRGLPKTDPNLITSWRIEGILSPIEEKISNFAKLQGENILKKYKKQEEEKL